MSEPVPLALHASKQQRELPSTLAAETRRAASPLKLPKKSLRLPLDTFGVEIMALREHHCRWPLLRAADQAQEYCGNHCPANVSYCVTHANLSYAPSPSRPRIAKLK